MKKDYHSNRNGSTTFSWSNCCKLQVAQEKKFSRKNVRHVTQLLQRRKWVLVLKAFSVKIAKLQVTLTKLDLKHG